MSPGTIRHQARLENLEALREFAMQSCRDCGGSPEACNMLELAIDEALTNVVLHAYDGLPPGDIVLTFDCDGLDAVITISDTGHPFKPEELPPPDLDSSWEERRVGGLGVHLIREIMDRAEYTYDPKTGNRLTMRKRLRPAPDSPSREGTP